MVRSPCCHHVTAKSQFQSHSSSAWHRLLTKSNHISTVVSVFAIIILSIIAVLYRSEHEEFPSKDPKGVSGTIFTAVIVYAVRFVRPKPPAFYRRVTNDKFLTMLIM